MHKKVIRGVPYFYTTVRERDKTKTIYLGREYDEALNEEKKLHRILENSGKEDKKFGILKLFFIFIGVLILFHGIYSLYNLGYIGAAVYEYNNVELEINKFVSPDAILFINGISQAIPLQLNDDTGVLGYDIKKLKLNLEFGEYLVEIKDRNNVIYRENVVVSGNAASESIENNSFTEPIIEDIANSSVNKVTPQFSTMATGAASVTVELNMTYLGNSTKYGNNATCYNVTTTNSDTVIYNWWLNNLSDNVLNLPFDTNSSTTTNDYSGYGNNGNVSITSAIKPTWNISGYIGGAYTFDGVDDWINVSDNNILDLTNNISIETWINPGSVQKAYADIADKGHNGATSTSGWVIQQNNLNQNQYYLAWYAGAGWQISSTISLTANRWQHFAIVKNGLNVKAYQDGVQKFDWNATNATIQTNDIAVVIGNAYGLSRQFNGTIDEVRIYNRTLTANEILDHNNSIYNKVRNDRLVVGQNWTCQVYPNNNTGDGLSVNSSNLFIVSNGLPVIENLNITSTNPLTNNTNQNISVNFVARDLDSPNEIVTNITNWWKNNISDTVLNLPFDTNTVATVTDYSGFGNAGTINGDIIWSSGCKIGGCYNFSGKAGAYISVGNNPIVQTRNNFSIDVWVYFKGKGVDNSGGTIAGKYDTAGWLFYIYDQDGATPNGVYFQSDGSGWSTQTDVPKNEWHYITYTRNGTDQSFYLDGVLKNITSNAVISSAASNFLIGDYATTANQNFNGSIDKFKFYNRTLTTNEILLHNATNYNIIHSDATTKGDIWHAQVWANDNTTDSTSVNSSGITILNAIPSIPTLLIPTNNSNISTINVTFGYNSTDIIDGDTISYSLFINGVLNQSSIGNVSLNFSDGNYNWSVIAGDSGGNSSFAPNMTFIVDATKPIINITYPTNNTNSTNNNLNINYSISDLNLDKCWYSNDSMSINTTITCGTNITTITWSEGLHNFTVWANDTLNNVNSSSVSFTIDTIAPAINITSPINNTNSSNTILNINYTKSDSGIGVQSCWYSNDTMTSNTTLTGCANITTVTWAEGQHNVTIWVNDSVNNVNSSYVRFTIDTTAPNITFVNPTQNNNVNLSQSYITVNVSVNDSLDIIDTCRFNLNNTWYGMTKSSVNNFVYCNTTISSLADGAYNYNITANDTLNNLGNSSTRAIRLDTTGPSVNITDPSNGDIITTNSLTINSIISDSLALDKCWYEHSNLNTTFVCGQNFSLSSLNNADYNISVWANDTLNNLDRDTIKFTISVTSPTATAAGGGGGGSPSSTAGQFIAQESEVKMELKQGQSGIQRLTFSNPGNEDLNIIAIVPDELKGKLVLSSEHSASIDSINKNSASITLSSTRIRIKLNKGETKEVDLDGNGKKETNITLLDTIDETAKIRIKTFDSERILIIGKTPGKFIINSSIADLLIKPRESKSLSISVIGNKPGLYVGNIIVKSNNVEKLIPVMIEIESKTAIIDAILDIPEDYKLVNPGERLKVQVTLKNIGKPDNLNIRYLIKEINGKEVYNEEEKIFVDGYRSYVKELDGNLKEGIYIIGIEAVYGDSFVVSSDKFEVSLAKGNKYGWYTLALIILIVFYLIVRKPRKLSKAF